MDCTDHAASRHRISDDSNLQSSLSAPSVYSNSHSLRVKITQFDVSITFSVNRLSKRGTFKYRVFHNVLRDYKHL